MRAMTMLLLAAAFVSALAGCQPTSTDPYEGLLAPDELAAAELQYYWPWRLKLDAGERVSNLYLRDENLYCTTTGGRIICIDAAVGIHKWSKDVAAAGRKIYPPTHVDEMRLSEKIISAKQIADPSRIGTMTPFPAVLVNTISKVEVFDRKTGKRRRTVAFEGFSANTGGASDGGRFYVATEKGWVYAYLLNAAVRAWWITTGDMISTEPIYYNGKLYIPSEDGTLYCAAVDVARGDIEWRQALERGITAGVHADHRGCFVPCEDNRLYAFDVTTGMRLWKPFVCQGPLRADVQVGQNSVFQKAERDAFYAIDILKGTKRWTVDDGEEVLAIIGPNVYLRTTGNELKVVDEVLGEVKATVPLTGMTLFVPNTIAEAIYAATDDGRVICLAGLDAPRITAEMLNKKN